MIWSFPLQNRVYLIVKLSFLHDSPTLYFDLARLPKILFQVSYMSVFQYCQEIPYIYLIYGGSLMPVSYPYLFLSVFMKPG